MSPTPDRLALLRAHPTLTGIDHVHVAVDQDALEVRFLKRPSPQLEAQLRLRDVNILPASADGPPSPAPTAIAWSGPVGRRVLRVDLEGPGPFGLYRLHLEHAHVDPFYNDIAFDFKANCPTPFDCEDEEDCPPEVGPRPLIDYRARDFESYRRALVDFASARWPEWSERHEADVGVMLLELMATLGDELAFYQDRVAGEAYLPTATQARSARAHARLVDYEIAPPLAAWTLLEIQVDDGAGAPAGILPAGTPVWAQTLAGERISFEVGYGLADVLTGRGWPVDSAVNTLQPHVWDEDELCLLAGSIDLFVKGAVAAALPLVEELDDGTPSRSVLLRTDPVGPDAGARPHQRLLVEIVAIEESADPLTGEAISRLMLRDDAPLPVDLVLEDLTVRGNLVPATAGDLRELLGVVGAVGDADPALPADVLATLTASVEREGPGDQPVQRIFLPETDTEGLCWVSLDGGAAAARPELHLDEMSWDGAALVVEDVWSWRRSLLGSASSLPDSRDFTLEDGRWQPIREFHRPTGDVVHVDYAGDSGQTIRFGDGEFGLSPARGTIVRVQYRVGGGPRGNVGPGTIAFVDDLPPGLVVTVSNPFGVDSGADAETLTEARRDAPQAWRAVTFRAVRPEDYAEAAARLPWVDRAEASTRWTGSWLSTFTTPDPRDRADLPRSRRYELEAWLERFRMTGRDSRVSDPLYADIDLELTVCASVDFERSDVAKRVRDRLTGGEGSFFDPDVRTFGGFLERSRLEKAIHEVPGVRAVEAVRIRRRGWFDWREMGAQYRPEGTAEILRVESDPSHPERGAVTLLMEGGS